MSSATNEGRDTSEFKAAKSSSIMGIVAMVLGFIISMLGPLVENMSNPDGNNPLWIIIVDGVVSVAGIIQKTLVDNGYINSRTAIKVTSLKNGNTPPTS